MKGIKDRLGSPPTYSFRVIGRHRVQHRVCVARMCIRRFPSRVMKKTNRIRGVKTSCIPVRTKKVLLNNVFS